MKIPSHFDSNVHSQLERLNTTPSQSESGVDAGFGPATTGTGAATLGSSAVALTQTALAQPDVRPERVEALRNQIAAGTYPVSTSQVAAAMLADPLTGLGSIGRD